MKNLLTGCAFLALTCNLSYAKEDIYFFNNGPAGSSGHTFYAMLADSLKDKYNISIVTTNGCSKVKAALGKIGNDIVITDVNARRLVGKKAKESCQFLTPTLNNHMFIDQKVGVVFGLKNTTKNFLKDTNLKIGYNKGRNSILKGIEKKFGVKYKYIEYKKSSQIIQAVLSGEVDFAIVNTSKKVFANDKLIALYNTGVSTAEGLFPLTSVGGGSLIGSLNFVYLGKNHLKDKIRSDMAKVYIDKNSILGKHYNKIKGQSLTLDKSISESYQIISDELSR